MRFNARIAGHVKPRAAHTQVEQYALIDLKILPPPQELGCLNVYPQDLLRVEYWRATRA